MEWTLGCATRIYAGLPFADACRHIATAGYDHVAVFGSQGQIPVQAASTREQVLAAQETARQVRLEPSLLLARLMLPLGDPGAVAEYRRLLDNARLLGARWMLDLGTSEKERRSDYIALMREAASYAGEIGLGVAMKPHGGISLTVDDLIGIHQEVNRPAFGICYDPGNILYYTKGELRPETDITRIAPLVSVTIIKDCVLREGQPDVMVTPGEGLVDFPAVLSGLVRGGFRGPLYVETVGGKAVEELDANAAQARRFVRELLARL